MRVRGAKGRPHTAVRWAATEVYSEGGVTATTYPSAGTSYSARLVPVGNPSDLTAADAPDTLAEYTLALPTTATVNPKDRFVVSGADLDEVLWSRTVEVIGTPGPHTHEVERLVRVTDRLST